MTRKTILCIDYANILRILLRQSNQNELVSATNSNFGRLDGLRSTRQNSIFFEKVNVSKVDRFDD